MTSTGEPEGTWTIAGVYLLAEGRAGDGDGRVAVPDLQLSVSAAGIDVAREAGEVAWRGGWADLEELSMAEHSMLPDGREGLVVLVVERGGRRHRFVLPTQHPLLLASQIRVLAYEHGLRTGEPRSPVLRTLTAAVIIASAAALTVLLLSAAHVIRF
jgi:hypothetical protein